MPFRSTDVAEGAALVERLAATKLPSELKAYVARFKVAQSGLEKAAALAETARALRDRALAAVSQADASADRALDALANKMAGAEMAKRTSPFAGFSVHTPSQLAALPYAAEAKEVARLVASVKRAKPEASVLKAAEACAKAATEVATKLKALAGPQAEYSKALATRDALLPDWVAAQDRLERKAIGAWADDPPAFESVFRSTTRVETRSGKGRRKKAATPAAPE